MSPCKKPYLRRSKEKRRQERKGVTVCVAAIAERSIIIGASDRMLTAMDVEYEPEQAKLWAFTNCVGALVAGDMSIQSAILREVDKEVKNWVVADPKKWVSVKDVVNLYCKKYRELRREHAEADILHPLGLDFQSFLSQQAVLSSDEIGRIVAELTAYELPGNQETIFFGVDTDGSTNFKGDTLVYPQLYATAGDKWAMMTTVGFAAIGIGKAHAESQLQFSGHQPGKTFDETVLLVYAAKKRAESAPGVGKSTDMIIIGPGLGESTKIEDKDIEKLEAIYKKSKRANERAIKVAQQETKRLVEKLEKEYAAAAPQKK